MSGHAIQELSDEELEFYSRQIVLKEIGYKGQLKLRKAKACIVGLGGLGCVAATQLTAMGVGHLRIVDRDIVELSNMQRQHLYSVDDIGYPKVEVAAKKLEALNPHVKIEPLPLSLNSNNAEDIIKEVNVVVDGLDHMEPRYAVNRACVKLKVPYVFGAAIMTFGNVSTIIPGETPCLECFYGNLKDELLPTCAIVGVHPSIVGVVASMEVAEAIRILTGEKPRLTNKLLYCDIGYMTADEINVARLEDCPVCGTKPRSSPKHLKREMVEEICGRRGKRTFVITPKKNSELNMANLPKLLKDKGFKVKVKAQLGITFSLNRKVAASILKSGVMITQGINEKEQALKLYGDVTKSLDISLSQI
jgi:adenylyltransferase/sulfurtransferase